MSASIDEKSAFHTFMYIKIVFFHTFMYIKMWFFRFFMRIKVFWQAVCDFSGAWQKKKNEIGLIP